MTYEQLKALEATEFKRFTGVQRATFAKMVEAVGEYERHKQKRGRPPKLSVADQVLVALQYWREYRPYSHIAVSWRNRTPGAKATEPRAEEKSAARAEVLGFCR